MGEVRVPRDALWRAQTQRAVENFPISGQPLEPALIHALAHIKAAAAHTNADARVPHAEQADAITEAAAQIVDGEHDDQFPIDVFQTGSGTSTNMNVNEVIATLAQQPGRRGAPQRPRQRRAVLQRHLPLRHPCRRRRSAPATCSTASPPCTTPLEAKSDEFADAVKSGRTHLMDATPVTLGQELGGYAAVVDRARERIEAVLPRVRELPLGGTAVGTGINAPAGFAAQTIAPAQRGDRRAVHRGPRPLRGAGRARRDRRAERRPPHVRRRAGEDLQRPALDGQRPDHRPGRDPPRRPPAGVEHHARQGQPGDPRGDADGLRPGHRQRRRDRLRGRVRLVRAERDAAGDRPQHPGVRAAARHARAACSPRCVDGITADRERMRRYAESSPSVVTPLNKYVGYESAAKIAKQALADGATIRETVIALGLHRAGRADRGPARRGPRHRKHDDIMMHRRPDARAQPVPHRGQPGDPAFGVAPDRRRPRPHHRGPRRAWSPSSRCGSSRSGPAPAASPRGWRRRCPAYGSRPSTSPRGSSS